MLFLMVVAAFGALAGTSAAVTDGEVWNEGVTFYRDGDVTNALRVLRPLMLSKTHGARAAEVVAKLCYDQAREPGATDPVKALEDAAAAAQIAVRADPADARLQRNFTRALDGLPELRETKRINAVLQAAQGKDPGAMLQKAVRDVRSLMTESASYRTNEAARVIADADRLEARARKLADVWIPVKEAICQAVTNEEQAATIALQVDQAKGRTLKAAKALGDLTDEAWPSLSEAEHDFNRFMKLTVLPPAAMQEDLVAQSNAWQDVDAFNGRSWQHEALDFTRAFRAKFPAWARAYEQQAQADTNKPPFTAEAQAQVSELSTRLEKLQLGCCEKVMPPDQEESLEIIRRILELLPKDGKGGGQSQPQPNQQPNEQQDKDKQQNDRDQQDQPPDDQRQGPQEQDDQKDDGQDEQDKDGEGQDEEKSADEREIEAVLKKAQERSDEHEAEKKARMRKAPLPPNERDW